PSVARMLLRICALLCVLYVTVWSQACNGIPVSERLGFISAHNKVRYAISSGAYIAKGKQMPGAKTPIPSVSWDCGIEASAQAVSDTCVFAHSTNRVNLGENLYTMMSSAVIPSFSGLGKAATDAWVQEFQDFGWLSVNLTREAFDTGIGHATQVAWAKSTKIGCGMTKCDGGKQVIVACQYRDAGNYLNQNIYDPKV
ncbi:hypothetical protein PFISCL1PPCAC_13731, partial [Pristionchus fissidentatus]